MSNSTPTQPTRRQRARGPPLRHCPRPDSGCRRRPTLAPFGCKFETSSDGWTTTWGCLGFSFESRTAAAATLGAPDADRPLVRLEENSELKPAQRRGAFGLFPFRNPSTRARGTRAVRRAPVATGRTGWDGGPPGQRSAVSPRIRMDSASRSMPIARAMPGGTRSRAEDERGPAECADLVSAAGERDLARRPCGDRAWATCICTWETSIRPRRSITRRSDSIRWCGVIRARCFFSWRLSPSSGHEHLGAWPIGPRRRGRLLEWELIVPDDRDAIARRRVSRAPVSPPTRLRLGRRPPTRGVPGCAFSRKRRRLEPDPRAELHRSRFPDRCNLAKRGRRIVGIAARAEIGVARDRVRAIGDVEHLSERLQLDAAAEREHARLSRALTLKKSLPVPALRAMNAPFTIGRPGRALNRGHAGRDVERQRRIRLQHAAQLEAVRERLPQRSTPAPSTNGRRR